MKRNKTKKKLRRRKHKRRKKKGRKRRMRQTGSQRTQNTRCRVDVTAHSYDDYQGAQRAYVHLAIVWPLSRTFLSYEQR